MFCAMRYSYVPWARRYTPRHFCRNKVLAGAPRLDILNAGKLAGVGADKRARGGMYEEAADWSVGAACWGVGRWGAGSELGGGRSAGHDECGGRLCCEFGGA